MISYNDRCPQEFGTQLGYEELPRDILLIGLLHAHDYYFGTSFFFFIGMMVALINISKNDSMRQTDTMLFHWKKIVHRFYKD